MTNFTYKGILSESMGVIVRTVPSIIKPPVRYTQYDVIGLDGAVLEPNGYSPYLKPIQIGLENDNNMNEVIGWLTGTGNLVISNEPALYYTATIMEQVEFTVNNGFKFATIPFIVQPYKYYLSNAQEILTKSGTTHSITITNDTTVDWLPELVVTGTSGFTVKIDNVTVMTVDMLDTQMTIDSMQKNCYNGITLLNRRKTGEYPVIAPGQHTLSVTGSTLANVKVRWNKRCL